MRISSTISNFLGLVPYGNHGIEVQHEGKQIAVFVRHKRIKRNWREAVQFALERRELLFQTAQQAWDYAKQHGGATYTWNCYEKQNCLRRGVSHVDALCFTVLPADAPESVRLAYD